jgi:hypothetical protein
MKINSPSGLRKIFAQGADRIWQLKTQNLKIDNDTNKYRIAHRRIRNKLFDYPEFIKFHSDFILKIESNEGLLSIHIIDQNEEKIDTIKNKYKKRITPLYNSIYSNKKTKTEINKLIRTKVESFLNNEILLLQTTNSLLLKSILKIDN